MAHLPFLTVRLYVVLGLFFTALFETNLPVLALLLTFLGIVGSPIQIAALVVHLSHVSAAARVSEW